MKKFLALILSLVCVFALAFTACGEQSGDNTGDTNNEQTGGNENNDPNGGNENNDPNGGNEGNENNGQPHEHTYDTAWSYDSQTHWHAATCHPEEKKNEASHIYEEGKCIVCKKAETYEIGETLPDFTLETFNSAYTAGSFSSADARGKVLVINFWYTTCGICNDEMGDIEEVRHNFGDDVVVVAIHLNEEEHGRELSQAQSHIASHGWGNYGIIFAKDNAERQLFNWFSGIACPMTVVVNGAGIVTARMQGNMFPFDWDTYEYGDNLTPAIEEAMANYSEEPKTPAAPETPDGDKQESEIPEIPENPDEEKQGPVVPENPDEGDRGEENVQPHECAYSQYWSCDENYHWHASTCSEHPEKVDSYAPHNYVNGRCADCKVSSSGTYNVGDRIPDFTVDTYGNNVYSAGTFSSENVRGKVLVINFWYVSCGICVEEMPKIENVRESFGDDVVVLALHIDNGEQSRGQAYLSKHDPYGAPQKVTWVDYGTIFAKDLSGSKIFNWFNGIACPMTVVVNGEGIVTAKMQGDMFPFDWGTLKYGDNLTPAINKAMGK